MELNWSTFVLEIINFLVLVWLLKHFLYKPVREVISRRQAGIEKTLADAKTKHAEAKQLQQQYENRLDDWEQERQKKREALIEELEAERNRQHYELQTRLKQEQEKALISETRRQHDSIRNMEETALQHGARFTAKLLTNLSGPDTETRIIERLIHDLNLLPAEQSTTLRNHRGEIPEIIEVSSAYPLSASQQQKIEQALHTLTGLDIPLHYNQDSDLVAGVRIGIGTWVISANIQDELHGFTELSHDD